MSAAEPVVVRETVDICRLKQEGKGLVLGVLTQPELDLADPRPARVGGEHRISNSTVILAFEVDLKPEGHPQRTHVRARQTWDRRRQGQEPLGNAVRRK